MKLTKTFLTFFIFLAVSQIFFAQEYERESNWIGEITGDYCGGYQDLTYNYKTFTKQDVIKAKEKLKFIKQVEARNEWEGVYSRGTAIGDSRLIWNSSGGFINFYCYHNLDFLNYGKTEESLNFVELISEKPLNSKPDKKQIAEARIKLIKVIFGKRHYLVPENHLKNFCERAVGLSTDLQDYSYYWMKVEDSEKEVFGLPVLPEEYKHLLRHPVEVLVIGFENKKIVRHKFNDGTINYSEIHYPVTLNAGKNKRIKLGMNFLIQDTGEWIEITKVFQKTSVGIIRRYFSENNQEECRDSEQGQGQIILCKEMKAGMKARTKLSEYFF